MKNYWFIFLACMIFSCEPEIEYVEQKPIRVLTAYDSLCEDISKGNKFKFVYPDNQITENITNSFAPSCYPVIKRGYHSNDSITNLIDSLEFGDTLHINYRQSSCGNLTNDIYSIIKQQEGYSLLKYSETSHLILGFLSGDSCLVAFHDSVENKFNTHILTLKDTNKLNKLAKRYLKQSYKVYNYKSIDIYHKIKELENLTTTNRQCQLHDGLIDCKLVFLFKNILQERYYLNESCRNIF